MVRGKFAIVFIIVASWQVALPLKTGFNFIFTDTDFTAAGRNISHPVYNLL